MVSRFSKAALALALLGASFSASAQSRPDLIQNVYGRNIHYLNGKWNAIIDLYDQGRGKEMWLDQKEENNTQFYEYAWENGLVLNVPGDFNSQLPQLRYYEGTVWYSRRFDVKEGVDSSERIFLYFGAVSQRCTIWLNGEEVGGHDGGFTPFQIEVTGKVKAKDNFLVVEVNNERRTDAIPALSFDWWSYGGITRDVMLVRTPKVFIKDYMVQLDKYKADIIHVDVTMSDAVPAGSSVAVSIPELKVAKTVDLDKDGKGTASIKTRKLRRWSPEDPKLYEVRLTYSGGDALGEMIGFRNINVEGTHILINGKNTFMRCISFHEEIPQRMGRACTEEDASLLLNEVRELGANMVRLAHYPQNEHIVRLAEKMGILIWQEIPVWQGIDFGNERTMDKALTMFSEMLYRDKNRCAVGFWGIANETRPSTARNAFLRKELGFARSVDSTRLYTGAFDNVYYKKEFGEYRIEDDLINDLDVVSFNKYIGWYEAWPCDPSACRWNVAAGKPVIISEFGSEALYGRHGNGEAASSWSEEYQAGQYRKNLEMFDRIPNLAGISPWILFDFRSPFRFHPTNQNGWNRKGLLSDQGQRKMAWYVIHDYYARKKAESASGEGGKPAAAERPVYKDASAPVERRIEDLLSRMTLEEKILQLNQYTLGRNNIENNLGETVKQVPAEAGSVIYFGDDAKLRNAMMKRCMEDSRLGIPMLFGHDVIHGYKTIAPIPLAMAASWNPALVQESCRIAAREASSCGVDWTFSPMVDVAHDPRWGRVMEGYGEDPYLTSVFCRAAVKGYQGDDLGAEGTIAACLKHFVGYAASEAGRDYVYTEISDQTLWDTYFPPFKAGVDAGASTLMSSFNTISGIPASANHYTMTEVLKGTWGFDGFLVSDWDAVKQLINQGMARDEKEAAALAFNAGLDMDMVDDIYRKHLVELFEEGIVSRTLIDDSVRRILRIKFRLGLFDRPYTPELPASKAYLQPDALAAAEELAQQSMVLLKNEAQLLPLKKQGKIALIGPHVNTQKDLIGNWRGRGEDKDVITLADGFRKEFAGCELLVAEGCGMEDSDPEMLVEALEAAKAADVVVLTIGERAGWTGENTSRTSIAIPQCQVDLLSAVKALGKKVVVLVASGRPNDLSAVEPLADAMVEIWMPGSTAGSAAAGIVSGRYNPSGRLPITFPMSIGQIPIYYNRRNSARRGTQGIYKDMTSDPLYTFGYGLSYSKFEYGDIRISADVLDADSQLVVKVDVKNVSDVDGMETVQLYICDPYCSIARPVKELKAFDKRTIKAGETEEFCFTLDPKRDFAFVDRNGRPLLEPGEYRIIIGDKMKRVDLRW